MIGTASLMCTLDSAGRTPNDRSPCGLGEPCIDGDSDSDSDVMRYMITEGFWLDAAFPYHLL